MTEVLGAFGLLDFTMLRPVLAWRAFLNYETCISLILQFFFGPRPTADTESADTTVHLYYRPGILCLYKITVQK